MTDVLRPDLCVLCGGVNGCGVAAGQSDCWCFATRVPEGLLARVPDEMRDRACICQVCIASFERENNGTERGGGQSAESGQ